MGSKSYSDEDETEEEGLIEDETEEERLGEDETASLSEEDETALSEGSEEIDALEKAEMDELEIPPQEVNSSKDKTSVDFFMLRVW